MIKFFEDIRHKRSDNIAKALLQEIENKRFYDEDDVLDFADLIDVKFGAEISLEDFLYVIDVAFDKIEEQ